MLCEKNVKKILSKYLFRNITIHFFQFQYFNKWFGIILFSISAKYGLSKIIIFIFNKKTTITSLISFDCALMKFMFILFIYAFSINKNWSVFNRPIIDRSPKTPWMFNDRILSTDSHRKHTKNFLSKVELIDIGSRSICDQNQMGFPTKVIYSWWVSDSIWLIHLDDYKCMCVLWI